jgi:hypothetical protein
MMKAMIASSFRGSQLTPTGREILSRRGNSSTWSNLSRGLGQHVSNDAEQAEHDNDLPCDPESATSTRSSRGFRQGLERGHQPGRPNARGAIVVSLLTLSSRTSSPSRRAGNNGGTTCGSGSWAPSPHRRSTLAEV